MNQVTMTRTAISIVFSVGYFALIYLVFTTELPEGNREAANIVLGVLTGALGLVLNFYFGSSQGSKEKTEILAHAVQPKE